MKRVLIVAVLILLAVAGLLEAQTTGPQDREIQRFVIPGTANLTGMRVHASTVSAHMSLALPRGNIAAMGGYKVPFVYAHSDQSNASLTNSAMPIAGTARPTDSGSGVTYQRVPFKGSIIGVSIGASTALTTGTATAEATILRAGSAVRTGLTAVISSTVFTQYNATAQDREVSNFTALEAVGCQLTTSSTMAPITAEFVCTIVVEY